MLYLSICLFVFLLFKKNNTEICKNYHLNSWYSFWAGILEDMSDDTGKRWDEGLPWWRSG